MEIFCDKELLIFIFPIKKFSENNTDMQDKNKYKSKRLMCLEKSFWTKTVFFFGEKPSFEENWFCLQNFSWDAQKMSSL